MLESLFNKVDSNNKLYEIDFKNRLQHRCFTVKFAKFLREVILKNINKVLPYLLLGKYHSLTHWSNLFGKLLLMNIGHQGFLSSSICSLVSSMSWSIYVFCCLPFLFFPFVGIQKSKLCAISSSCLHMCPENFNRR